MSKRSERMNDSYMYILERYTHKLIYNIYVLVPIFHYIHNIALSYIINILWYCMGHIVSYWSCNYNFPKDYAIITMLENVNFLTEDLCLRNILSWTSV